MSSMVPQYRKEAIEALGANVEIYGSNSDEADLYAREISKKENIPLIFSNNFVPQQIYELSKTSVSLFVENLKPF